jgi:hypothetical protein
MNLVPDDFKMWVSQKIIASRPFNAAHPALLEEATSGRRAIHPTHFRRRRIVHMDPCIRKMILLRTEMVGATTLGGGVSNHRARQGVISPMLPVALINGGALYSGTHNVLFEL